MSDTQTEAGVIAHLAERATEPRILDPQKKYVIFNGDGTHEIEDAQERPQLVKANRIVGDAASFVQYFENHAGDKSEVWADPPRATVVGIIDANDMHGEPEWEQHRLQLVLDKSNPWKAWEESDGKWLAPIDFAEFIELRATDVREPASASLLDMAQHFTAHRSVQYERGERMKDGETKLHYKETITAKAGQKDDVDIPDQIKLALRPFVGGPIYWVWARFRYRLNGPDLLLGYVLERPQEVLDAAFADIVDEIRYGKPATESKEATDASPSVIASPGHKGLDQPIYFGRP